MNYLPLISLYFVSLLVIRDMSDILVRFVDQLLFLIESMYESLEMTFLAGLSREFFHWSFLVRLSNMWLS